MRARGSAERTQRLSLISSTLEDASLPRTRCVADLGATLTGEPLPSP
jgi:hypothetical protein